MLVSASDFIVRRVNALPVAARRVIALGCLQRCYPFFLRNIETYPPSAAYRPAVERGLELAWTRHEGRPVDEDECRSISAEMVTFVPGTPDGWDGDWSWIALGPMALADELHFHIHDTWDGYISDALGTAADLVFSWYANVEMKAGRDVVYEDQISTSAYLLELATQARHAEWLRYRALDAEVVRRVRADSDRVGAELLSIVDGWRAETA